MSHPKTEWSKIYPGYKGTGEVITYSGWCETTVQKAYHKHACKNATRVCELDPKIRPKCPDLLFSDEDARNMRFLKKTLKRKPRVEELRNIDIIRAQYEAGQPISVPKKTQSTAAPKAAQPKEATAAVVEISSRRSQINERLWNIAAGFVIAGGIALGFIAFMVVCIGVAALM